MAVLFRGSGIVWIPAKHRSVRFVDGVYSTDDADEIAVLSLKYEHEIPAVASNVLNSENCNEDNPLIVLHNNMPDEVKPKRGRKPNAVRDN